MEATPSDREKRAESLVDAFLASPRPAYGEPEEGEVTRRALATEGDERGAIVRAALARTAWLMKDDHFPDGPVRLKGLVEQLLDSREEIPEADLRDAVRLLVPLQHLARKSLPPGHWQMPLRAVTSAVMRWTRVHGVGEGMRLSLVALRKILLGWKYVFAIERKMVERIDAILETPSAPAIEAGEGWSDAALADLAGLDVVARGAWEVLLRHARTAPGGQPSPRWSNQGLHMMDAIGRGEAHARIAEWLERVAPPSPLPLPGSPLMRSQNADVLRGLAYLVAAAAAPEAAMMLGDLGARCLKKSPRYGALSAKVGNACVVALGEVRGREAVAQLERLRRSVKYVAGQRLIGRALEAAARGAGLAIADLEELSVPTFGLTPDGSLRRAFGEASAELRVSDARDVALRWFDADGRERKTPPAEAKAANAAGVRELARLAKEIAGVLPAQRDRIERLAVEGRSWAFAVWRERYLDHPLLGGIARRLVWRFGEASAKLGVWRDDGLVGADGGRIGPGDDDRVSLWHPLGTPADTVRAWRAFIEGRRIVQPFKQAHREVYALTDAERATRTYSNRFAGHIVRQHAFAALCRERGWRYRLEIAGADTANTPSLEISGAGLRAELQVAGLEGDATDSGALLHLSTDRLCFLGAGGEPRPLEEIDALLLSEVMRDVDLFVAVTNVGNDPTWRDRGPEGHHGYWSRAALGPLDAFGETRKAVLGRLRPLLKIASRCAIEGRFLRVRGELRTYKIHLGSGNILMEPNDQHLCIVPSARPREAEPPPALPFEGDHAISVILSKAFLLANDARIKDPSIVSQIRGK